MNEPVARIEGDAAAPRHFRYYDLIMAAFVAILLLSNIIGAAKPSYVTLPGGTEWSFGAGVLFFPISYVIGDVLTEVYGYARARRVIWTGFAALAFMAFMAWVVVQLPPAKGWPEGGKPTPAAGLMVSAYASGLDHPRWLYTLPNGDVLVAETNAPPKPEDSKGIKGRIMKMVMKRAGAGTPSANRITLLRDADGDGVADDVDNCPSAANATQANTDSDSDGDACDTDDDNDTVLDVDDNCPVHANTTQSDFDSDGEGNACDEDDDREAAECRIHGHEPVR